MPADATRWTALPLLQIRPITHGGQEWRAVRHELGLTAHGINAYTGREPGDQILDDHDEADVGHEELYVVLSGRATFQLGDDELDAPAGTLVFVRDPALRRVAHAAAPRTTILCTGGPPGAFEPSEWEEREVRRAGL
jgi:hypothetical protein